MTTHQMPRQITASIHQDAIKRVSDFFDATIATIANELLQNSRRAGATGVDITVADGLITVTDDGAGIADPETILSFGLSQWSQNTTDSENPAGMGLYALARRTHVRIQSKAAHSQAWQVNLSPDHFVGRVSAPVENIDNYDKLHGTTVEFTGSLKDESIIANAAKYYPLPVHINGKAAPQEDFLQHAIHTELWQGARIGVHTSTRPITYSQSGTLNFHGALVNQPSLPYVAAIESYWSTKVDVVDCPHLDLTLPARQEIVQSPFADELRAACRAAIYRAMLLQPQPVDVPKAVQQDAATLGINIPDATARLAQWTPDTAQDGLSYEDRQRLPITDDSILVILDISTADQQALSRAAERNGAAKLLFEPDHRMDGYDWYDSMIRSTDYSIIVSDEHGSHELHEVRQNDAALSQRPDRIEFILQTKHLDETDRVHLFTDLAFEKDEDVYMDEVRPLITRESDLSTIALVELMKLSFFYPSDDKDSDSYDTQEETHEEAYSMTAIALLESEDQAFISSVTEAVHRHIIYQIPVGSTATIKISRNQPIQITLAKDD